MRILLTLAALAALASPAAAQQTAAPAPTKACDTLQYVLTTLDNLKEKHVELSAKSLVGVDAIGLGAIVISTFMGHLVIGFEINGCVTSPVIIATLPGGDVGT